MPQVALMVSLLLSGCAASATGRIFDAVASVESAQHADADKYALYEYVKADAYLHKAKEEYGYADYEVAGKFADESVSWGDKAREKARERPTSPPPLPQPPTAPPPVSGPPIIVPVAPNGATSGAK
jgi:Domain of unknown function (DUF4398)